MAESTRRVGRPSGPTAKGDATRAHIISSAASVFAVHGFAETTMAMVIEESGMTKGAVYFHFDSKLALAEAVLTSKTDRWLAAVDRGLAAAAPGRARFSLLLPVMLELHESDPQTWAVSRLSKDLARHPETQQVAAALMGRWVRLVAGLIEESQALGEASPTVDPTAMALVLIAAFDGLKATRDVLQPPAQRRGVRDESFIEAAVALQSMAMTHIYGEDRP